MKKFFNIKKLFPNLPKKSAQNEVWANPVRDWMILLLLSALVLLSVFGYAMYRFYIWQNLEEHLPATQSNNVQFEKTKAERVTRDFLEREAEANQISPTTSFSISPAATTTETTDEETEEGSTNPDGTATIRVE